MAQIKTTIAISVFAHALALASIGMVVPNGARMAEEPLTPVELVEVERGEEKIVAAAPPKKVETRLEAHKDARPQLKPIQEAREEPRKEIKPEPEKSVPAQVAPEKAFVSEPAPVLRHVETQPAAQASLKREDGQRPPSINPDTEAAFNSYVIRKIDRAKLYPNWARQRGYEGNVLVRFRLAADGTVSELKVISPCECDILNKAACSAIQKAAPFNDGPANGNAARVMEVNIGFRLRR